ncbi:glycosyltransferase [Chloroflexota bacterium]
MKTSVVISTKNNVGTIEQCVSSLMPYYKQGYISEIIIVDAHSTDGTLEVVKNYPVKLVFDEGRIYAIAIDIGWRNAEGDPIIFLDADAYVGENFFPQVYGFFSDEQMGIIGCQPKPVVTNRLTKAIGEQWAWSAELCEPSLSWFKRLYLRILSGGYREPLPGGPCQVVRRICLEAVDGFPHYSHNADLYLSQRIVEKGWKSAWWTDAPLYHYPRSTIKRLMRQYYRLGIEIGQSISLISSKEKSTKFNPRFERLLFIIGRLASVVVALMLAIRFRNPTHLIIYPLSRYAGVIGYIVGCIGARKSMKL